MTLNSENIYLKFWCKLRKIQQLVLHGNIHVNKTLFPDGPLKKKNRLTARLLKPTDYGPVTFKRVPCQTKLADNVSWDVGLDALAFFGMTLGCLQEMIELFRVKLLQDRRYLSLTQDFDQTVLTDSHFLHNVKYLVILM